MIAPSAGVELRDRGRALASVGDIAVLTAITAWSVLMIGQVFAVVRLSQSSRLVDLALLTPALALGSIWAFSSHRASVGLRIATGWSAVLAAALLLTPQVLDQPSLAFGIPGAILLTWLVYKRPALGAVTLMALTASFGALSLYLTFPYKRAITILFIAFWAAMIVRLWVGRRRDQLSMPYGVLLAAAYVVVSAAQVVFSANAHVALAGFELAPLFLLSMFFVAYSQWLPETHVRIVRWLLVTGCLVGAYATFRMIVGPSSLERAWASRSIFDFVNGHLKDIGSFLSAPDLAEWTSLMIPFFLSCALGLRGRMRVLSLCALPLLTIGLFASRERAPVLGASLAVIAVAILHVRPRAFSATRIAHTIAALLIIIGLGASAYGFGGGSDTGHSYMALLTADTHDMSVAAHEYKWQIALHDLSGHPFGYGLGTAPAGYVSNARTTHLLPVTGFSVDNGFLKIALEQGLAVMTLFGLALAFLAGGLVRGGLTLRDPARATLALGAAGTAICLFVLEGAGPYVDGVPVIAGWLVIGIGLAQLVQRRPASAS